MDANELLVKVRADADGVITALRESNDVYAAAMSLVTSVALLDGHLSAGGTPPEVWAEGPDAVPADDMRVLQGDGGRWYVFDGDTPIVGPFDRPSR